MNTRLVAAIVLLVGGIGMTEPLLACGEKFLMRSRGTRFQRATPARTPASILVYANPALNLPKALANVPVDATLRKAGYRPTTVTSPEEFQAAMGRGGWDLVLLDVADAIVVPRPGPNANSPIVLPVTFNATKSELAAAKKQHQRVLNTPIKNQSFLDAIDHALADRPATPAADKSGR
jgi:CheY-like chemotaxis protein